MPISKALAQHAVDELLQMGYTVKGDALYPPERLSEFACKFFGVSHLPAPPAKPADTAPKETQ